LLAINDPRRALILANEQGQQQGQAETDVSFGGDIFCGGSGAGSSSGDGAKVDTTAGVVAGADNQVNGFTKPPLPDVDTTEGLALARTEEKHQQQFGAGASGKKTNGRARINPVPPPPARLQQSRGAKKKGKGVMQRMIDDEGDFEDDVDGEDAMVEMLSNAVDDLEEEAEHGRHGDSDYDSEELASEDGSEEQASGDEGEYDEEAGDVPASPLWNHDHDSASESSENGEFGEENEEEEGKTGGGEDNAPAAMAVEAQGWLENEEDDTSSKKPLKSAA
jgi:hypothetical protein